MSSSNQVPIPHSRLDPTPSTRAILGILLLVAYLTLVFLMWRDASATFLPLRLLWEFDAIAFLPTWCIAVLAAVLGVERIPGFQRTLRAEAAGIGTRPDFDFVERHKLPLLIVVACLFSILFYSIRIEFIWFKWQGDVWAQIMKAMAREYDTSKFLSGAILYRFHKFLNFFVRVPLSQSLRLYDAGTGFVFVLLVLLVADSAGKRMLNKGLLYLLIMSSGCIVVFFGGNELLLLGAVAEIAYLYAGLLCARRELSIITPFVLLCFSILIDLQMLALVPSAAFLAYERLVKQRIDMSANVRKVLITVAMLVTFLAYALVLRTHWVNVAPIVAPRVDPEMVTLLEFRHLWEFLNGIALLSGGSVIVIVFLLYQVLSGRIELDPVFSFMGTTCYFFLCAAFVRVLPGGIGEWTALSNASIACTVTAAYGLVNLLEHRPP